MPLPWSTWAGLKTGRKLKQSWIAYTMGSFIALFGGLDSVGCWSVLQRKKKGNIVENVCLLQYHVNRNDRWVVDLQIKGRGNSHSTSSMPFCPLKRVCSRQWRKAYWRNDHKAFTTIWESRLIRFLEPSLFRVASRKAADIQCKGKVVPSQKMRCKAFWSMHVTKKSLSLTIQTISKMFGC